jgi:hypothetical protein
MKAELLRKLKIEFIPCQENNFRPEFLKGRILLYAFIFALVLKLISSSLLVLLPDSAFFAAITKTSLIDLTNQERQSLGMNFLQENQKLNEAAALKAQNILEGEYFSHYSPEGISPWYWFERAGYNYDSAGENLAIGFLDAEEVYNAWYDSPSHQANLLNPEYKEIGIGVAKGTFQGNETTIVVQLFGTPKKEIAVAPVVIEDNEEVEEVIVNQEEMPIEVEVEPVQGMVAGEFDKEIEKEASVPKVVSFLALEYHDLVHKVLCGFLIIAIIALFIDIFVRFDIQDKALIAKATTFILLIAVLILINKEVLIKLISDGLKIY